MAKNISVITGGAGGLGKAIARELGKGSTLLLGDLSEEKLEKAKKELEETGYEVYTFKLDVCDRKNADEFAKYAASLGFVKNVVHTAGLSPASFLAEPIIKVNAIGTINITEAFYNVEGEGSVHINFGSVAAYQAPWDDEVTATFDNWADEDFYDQLYKTTEAMAFDEFVQAGTAYATSKQFVITYSKANVSRFYAKGARILTVSPGSYLTPMHQALIDNQPEDAADQLELIPTGRWGHPYEMGALIAFLCSPGAGYIGGVDILADGGQIGALFTEQIE